MLSYEAARAKVMEVLGARADKPETEIIRLVDPSAQALGRALAEDIIADRNYPPFDHSSRDGFAVQFADTAQPGARLHLIGESRAGAAFDGTVGPGECVRILTGAPLPRGASAVVMQEYAHADEEFIVFEQPVVAGQNYVLAGAETRVGETVLRLGTRLGYAELAMAAQVGRTSAAVTRRPRVAILCTGDEVVAPDETPSPVQIRNSNCVSLAAQVALACGEPIVIGNARDETAELRAKIEIGLKSEMLVLSGGVSVGKYDLVEQVLSEFGAEFFFNAVAIRPGRSTVFCMCHGKPVFGLPGNPVSTMVAFELLVVPAIDCMSGCLPQPLPLFKARLAHPINEKARLTHFLPARLKWLNGEPRVELILWEGSGDIGAVTRGNCFLVVHDSRLGLEQDESVDVLPRRGMF
jgi:molybdopterin molybdotransferase